jgi:hypothetical protein
MTRDGLHRSPAPQPNQPLALLLGPPALLNGHSARPAKASGGAKQTKSRAQLRSEHGPKRIFLNLSGFGRHVFCAETG